MAAHNHPLWQLCFLLRRASSAGRKVKCKQSLSGHHAVCGENPRLSPYRSQSLWQASVAGCNVSFCGLTTHTHCTGASQSSLRPRLIGLRPRLPRRLVASGIAMRCMSPLVRPILPAILRQRMAAAERAYWFVSLAEDGQTSRRAAARHRGQHSLGRSTQHPPCAFTLAWPSPRPQPHPAWSRPNRRAPSCVSVRRRAESCRRGEGRGQRGAERS